MADGWLHSVEDLLDEPYGPPPGESRLGELTKIVVLRGQVIDVRQEPVSGSGYECAAMEMEHLHPTPTPPARVERVVVRESPHEQMTDWLERVVGGPRALAVLDTEPLPPSSPVDVTGLRDDVRDIVQAVDEQLERAAAGWVVSLEMLTACRRLLLAAEAAGSLRVWRDLEPHKIAATIVHCVAKANALVGHGAPFTVAHWLRDLGTTSAPTGRSATLAATVGGAQWPHGRPPTEAPDVHVLGDPAMLVSRFRRQLIAYRDLAERIRPA